MSGARSPLLPWVRLVLVVAGAAMAFGWMLHAGKKRVHDAAPASQASVPRALVGVWTATRGNVVRCIELREDGWFNMVPNTEAGDRVGWTGTWRVVGQDIVWRDDHDSGVVDTNRMIDVADGHFDTLEADRSQTKFDRLLADPAARCPR
jgi:hypothetical protein